MTNLQDTPSIDLSIEQRKRFASALEQYLNWMEQGVSPDLERLLRENPDLVDAFRKVLPSKSLENPKREPTGAEAAKQPGGSQSKARQADESLPRRLGDFELLEEVGRGGMGIVFRARQISLDRTVAVKILPNAATWDKRQIARFHNEAQAAAQLNHPNIVSVHSVGNESATYFYSMPFIDGISLEKAVQRIKQDPTFNLEKVIPIDNKSFARALDDSRDFDKVSLARKLFASADAKEKMSRDSPIGNQGKPTKIHQAIHNTGYLRAVVEIVAQAAEALHYAHQRGIVHRDVKPSNLILDRKGNLWITDFGLAMVSGCNGLTGPGDIMGTLKYMSPEQAAGKTTWIDERSDIYSLGITMYELLTLQGAVEGDDRMAMLKQIQLQTPPSARKRNPAISRTLENILLKAISKYPEERYATAAQFAEDLRLFLASGRSLANRPGIFLNLIRSVRRHPGRFAFANFGLLALVMGLAPTTFWVSSRNAVLTERHASLNRQLHHAHSTLHQLGMPLLKQLELYPGTGPLQKDIGRQGANFLEPFLEYVQKDPSYRTQAGSLRLDLARLHAISKPDSESLLEYQNALSQLMDWDTDNTVRIDPLDWFRVQHELAKLRIRLGLLGPAISELQQFLQSVQTGRFQNVPQEGSWAPWEAILRLDLSLALGLQDAFVPAEKELSQALTRLQTNADPSCEKMSSRYWSEELITALLRSAHSETTRPELGHELIQKAIAIAYANQVAHVTDFAMDRQLAQCFLALGLNHHRLGRNQEALPWFRRATRITERLVTHDPSNLLFQHEHATALNSLGQLELAVGKSQAALEAFRHAVDILEGITRLHCTPAYRSSLACALHDLATVAIQDRESHLAKTLLDRAIEEQQAALHGSPNDTHFQARLHSHERLREELNAIQ